jgi:hypothetical protein
MLRSGCGAPEGSQPLEDYPLECPREHAPGLPRLVFFNSSNFRCRASAPRQPASTFLGVLGFGVGAAGSVSGSLNSH